MATSAKQVNKFAAESGFIFVGNVVKTRAATVEGVATDNTAIVHVDRVVSAPDMFTSLGGHEITVRFKKMPALRKGSSLTFFTNGWLFGDSIAVDVVGTAADTGTRAAAGPVRQAFVAEEDRVLSARLASAAMTVVGTVSKVTKIEREVPATAMAMTAVGGTTHISEHDPNWHEATIDVDEVIKGNKGVKQVAVQFPASDDVRWYKVKKYAVGEQGIWMLQPGAKQDPKGVPAKLLAALPVGPDVLTTLHDADFLPLHELERVRALAKK
jgi:hypothetical protein